MQFRVSISVLVLVGCLPGQAVVPSNLATSEGNTGATIAGFRDRTRQQFLFHERVLRSLAGRSIRRLRFRRADAWGEAFDASTSRLTVHVRPGSVAPALARERFDQNRPSSQPVFQGTISLPASPMLTGPTTWSARHTVSIPLSRPVPYTLGQHLCIDIEGEPVNPPADFGWPVDFIVKPVEGRSEALGRGCGVVGVAYNQPLIVVPSGLVAGANMRVVAIGRVRTPGLLILGSVLAQPLPLDSLGMTGCVLRVDPKVVVPISYGTAATVQPYPSANAHLTLPRQPAMLGAQFGIQAANLESGGQRSNPLGVTLTNGLKLTLSTRLVDPDWTTVWSDRVWPGAPFPATGTIRLAFAPVLRIDT